MSVHIKSAECPKDKGLSLESGKGKFKCRLCGHEFSEVKANKYQAKKSKMRDAIADVKTSAGIKTPTFESNLERRFLLNNLVLRMKAGEITNIRWKPRIEIEPGLFYRPEATYYDNAMGTDISVDTKGGATKGGRFPVICIVWRNHMDHPLHVVEQKRRGMLWKTTRKILPRGKAI